MQTIISVPDSRLRQVSKPVAKVDHNTINFIQELGNTLTRKTNPPGVGLSAIQVGTPIRIFFTYLPKDKSLPSKLWSKDNLELKVHINPTITKKSNQVSLGGKPGKPFLEGCLSIPHIYGPVWRHESLTLQYQTLDTNNQLIEEASHYQSFPARVIQHEFDHLEGILFTDYALGQSPAKSFNPLGSIDQVLFDQDDELVPVPVPAKLINW
jgi:peptide deformylase